MAIKTKADLKADIDTDIVTNGSGDITAVELNTILNDMVDSNENNIQAISSSSRDLLTPAGGDKIFNTTSKRLEVYSGTEWRPAAQMGAVAINCAANPNYPDALVGDLYIVSAAGKIGGSAGTEVSIGDFIYCIEANAGGSQASVGSSWYINQTNRTDGSVILTDSLSLATADIEASDTAIDFIAAPGSGKIIVPIQTITIYTFNTTPFSAGSLQLIYDGGTVPVGDLLQEFAQLDADEYAINTFSNLINGCAKPNAKLQVKSSAAPSGGDGSIKIQIYYRVHTL